MTTAVQHRLGSWVSYFRRQVFHITLLQGGLMHEWGPAVWNKNFFELELDTKAALYEQNRRTGLLGK